MWEIYCDINGLQSESIIEWERLLGAASKGKIVTPAKLDDCLRKIYAFFC